MSSSPATTPHQTECAECGLLQWLPQAHAGAIVGCHRCGALVRQVRGPNLALPMVSAALGLALLALAGVFPLASVTAPGGKSVTADLASSLQRLQATGAWELVIAVSLTLLLFPAIKLWLVTAMGTAVRVGHVPRWLRAAFTWLPWFRSWAMIDVYLLGAMVALFRMRSQGYVAFEPALFALLGAGLCSVATDATVDDQRFWERVPIPGLSQRRRRHPHPLRSCEHCGLFASAPEDEACPRCTRRVRHRTPDSVVRTWSLVVAGVLLLVPANLLPVMTVSQLGQGEPSTIWHGVIELLHRELYGLAAIVFVASLVVPILKLLALAALLITTQRGASIGLKARTRTYRFVLVLGRWSMIDIFATMTIVALARFGLLGEAFPEPGAVAFCAVVFATMLAAEQFDPRLMWDRAEANEVAGGQSPGRARSADLQAGRVRA